MKRITVSMPAVEGQRSRRFVVEALADLLDSGALAIHPDSVTMRLSDQDDQAIDAPAGAPYVTITDA